MGLWEEEKINKIKFVASCAAGGFLFSLLCGLISKVNVLRLFLMALIFAVVFAVLAFAIQFLFNNFLAVDSSASFESDAGSPSPVSSSKKGQTVDIVIKDDELPVEENSNSFYVGSNRAMLNKGDYGGSSQASEATSVPKSKPVADMASQNKAAAASVPPAGSSFDSGSAGESKTDAKFVPVKNLETLYNVSGKESVTPSDVDVAGSKVGKSAEVSTATVADAPRAKSDASYTAADEELDTLPDMDGFNFAEESSTSSGDFDSGMGSDSSFASSYSSKSESNEGPDIKDASLIAKAISTVLASES